MRATMCKSVHLLRKHTYSETCMAANLHPSMLAHQCPYNHSCTPMQLHVLQAFRRGQQGARNASAFKARQNVTSNARADLVTSIWPPKHARLLPPQPDSNILANCAFFCLSGRPSWESWRTPATCRPNLVNVKSVFGRIRSQFSRIRSNLGRVHATFGRSQPKLCRSHVKFGRNRHMPCRCRDHFGRNRAEVD